MAKVTYLGPGDAVELDGLRFERGKAYEVTNEQFARIRASDPRAAVDGTTSAETPLEHARILEAPGQAREKAARDRRLEEERQQDELEKLQDQAAERAAKSATEEQARQVKRQKERDEARAEAAKMPRGGKG
jgi:hypothetical protein